MSHQEPPVQPPPLAELPAVDSALEPLIDRAERAVLAGDLGTLRALVGQLWPERRQLPELLTQRLIAGRTRAPLLTLELLGGFAGREAAGFLRRVAEHPAIADLVRWSARRRLGWPQRGETRRRLAFLASLRDPDRALLEAVAQATTAWPPDGEMLEEVLAYLVALPTARRQGLVQRLGAQLGGPAAWLLHALLMVDDPATQRAVLAELARLRPPGAAAAAGRLAATARTLAVRAQAGATAQRLSLRLVDGQTPATATMPPLTKALVSALDGQGAQLALVVRQWPDGLCLLAQFACREDWGVREVVGQCRATADQLAASLAGLHAQGIQLVEVDLAAVRSLLADAVGINAATNHRLPPSFELWEPIGHARYPPADEGLARAWLDDAAYADRPELLRASARLADHSFFQGWSLPAAASAPALLPAETKRGRRAGQRLYSAPLERVLAAPLRARWRERLRRQAWVLDRAGEAEARDIALALAAQLAHATTWELAAQPFWQRLVLRSATPSADAWRFGA